MDKHLPNITGSIRSALLAGLKYVNPDGPGITRRRRGKGFVYRSATGQLVRDVDTLSRIRSLVIPPAWEDVWICPDPLGHLQAIGRDARGRKQYRYHADFRAIRDQAKYDRMINFARALPLIRRRSRAHLRKRGLPREKVLAAIVQLLEKTLIRVGNEEYARQNHSFGLTTLQDHHASVCGQHVRFRFRGKSGVRHEVDFDDRRLARVIKRCQDLPGEELLQFVGDDGAVHDIGSGDVNAYLRDISGNDFTAKDFRTWAGTVLAAMALREMTSTGSAASRKKNIVAAVERVAQRLGNTKAVCRKCYIHPLVLSSYLDGTLVEQLQQKVSSALKRAMALDDDETAVLRLLCSALRKRRKAA